MAEETTRERRERIRRQEEERLARKDAEHAAWLAGHPDRAALLALNLASEVFVAGDGYPAVAVHTNKEASDLLLSSDWLAAHDTQVKAEAWDEGVEARAADTIIRRNVSETKARNPYRRAAETKATR